MNYVAETIQGTGADASKETNKQVAKDDDAKISTRASAAKDAIVDKKNEKSHDVNADVHKGKANCVSIQTDEKLTLYRAG